MIIRAAGRSGQEIGKTKMLQLVTLTFSIALAGCNATDSEVVMDDSNTPEVANEALVKISEPEMRSLKEKAQNGDLESAKILANFYTVNSGINSINSIKWQLQAARLGDCEQWADLMFLVNEEDFSIPNKLFFTGESLVSIGEASKCPKYRPQKSRP